MRYWNMKNVATNSPYGSLPLFVRKFAALALVFLIASGNAAEAVAASNSNGKAQNAPASQGVAQNSSSSASGSQNPQNGKSN